MPRKKKAAPGKEAAQQNPSIAIVADADGERKQPRLTGDRNQCPTCHLLFNSTKAFDRHRIGRFGVDRRCRTVDEMLHVGMLRNGAGFWITEPRTEPPRNRVSGVFSTPEVCEYPPSEKRAENALGRCPCGAEIASNVRGIRCPTCSAWARWKSAHRLAAHYLQEATP